MHSSLFTTLKKEQAILGGVGFSYFKILNKHRKLYQRANGEQFLNKMTSCLSLSLQGRWEQEGGCVTGRLVAWTAAR